MSGHLYIGLMSGTSTDGVDAVLANFANPLQPQVVSAVALAMPPTLRNTLLALNTPGENELHRAAEAGLALSQLYSTACEQLLHKAKISATDICAIGAHGQTVRHHPDLGFTIQLNAPAHLTEMTGIDVIADFRSRDIAAGGQGAPLVPAFHQALFGKETPRAVVNLGGIANITRLHPEADIIGFDTGPANVLLDYWCEKHTGQSFDHNGQWGSGGSVNVALLDYFLQSEPWFTLAPPKSTGRDLFNANWLDTRLKQWQDANKTTRLLPQDIQATLVLLTARSVANAIKQYAAGTEEVLVCGGGAKNTALMRTLQVEMACPVAPTDNLGVDAQHVEALAFAWLAWAYDTQHPAGMPEVTGARHPSILGCRYYA
ncbi:MAG: anhydro-N-acetylmuramic acid kinase [Pusillimonas sp.]|nr:anhydro-N-acetylmuramic acid kinase [Pusillimonas sp.]